MKKFAKLLLSGTLAGTVMLTGTSPAAFCAGESASSFSVSRAFSSNMVVQRGEKFRVWGFASQELDGQTVTLDFMGETASASVQNGKWTIIFPKELGECSEEGHDMTVSCAGNRVVLSDVLVGDVYMVVGQSNIAYTFDEVAANAPEDYPGSDIVPDENDPIRLCNNGLVYRSQYPTQGTDEVCEDVVANSGWTKTDRANVGPFSAVGYFFAKELIQNNGGKVPIGLVEINGNGCAINTFLPNEVADGLGIDQKGDDGIYRTDYAGTKLPTRFMYNHYMYPFRNMAVAGMVWYQGESDFIPSSYETYADRFTALVNFMRDNSNLTNRNFPVYAVELAPMYNKDEAERQYLPTGEIRSVMGAIPSKLDNCFFASSSDLWKDREYSNNLHPYCKYPQARRLAAIAFTDRSKSGALDGVIGPHFDGYSLSDDRMTLTLRFKYAANRLEITDGRLSGLLLETDSGVCSPSGYKIAGAFKNYLVLTCDRPIIGVKYGSETDASSLETLSITSKNGIPAVAFRQAVLPKAPLLVGDINGNGKLDIDDALKSLQYAVGKTSVPESSVRIADVNADGVIGVNDSLFILMGSVGKIKDL